MNAIELYSEIYSVDPSYKLSDSRYRETIKFLKLCGIGELKGEEWRKKSSIDVSCGRGEIVDYFEFLGYVAAGTEIIPQLTVRRDGIMLLPPFANRKKIAILNADVITCFDVLEHLDEEALESALVTLSEIDAKKFVFSISTREAKGRKHQGKAFGKDLHLTVKPPSWWIFMLQGFFSKNMIVKADPGMGMLFAYISKEETEK